MSKKGRSFVKSEKAARGKNGKIAAAAVTGLLFTVVPAVGCASNTTKGEDYNWNYNKPFFAEADDFMSVDGVLDEEKWQGQNKMEHTSDGITFTATTVFTEKGLYLGLQAFDKNIQWYTRNEFGSNSSFGIKIVKTGEPTYNVQGWYEHPNRNNYYNIDAKTSRSYRETQYNAAAVVDGELNSGETKSLTAELFVPWESLHYSEEELGENGYPDDVQIFVSYMKIVAERSGDNRQLVPGFMEGNRYDTFFLFGPEGLKHVYNSATLGNAVNGVSATDRWIIDDAAGTATTNEDRTQMLWFKNEYSSDFIMEADVTVHKPSEGYHPSVGLISYANQENIGLYAYTGRSLTDNAAGNKVISLKTGTMTDGLQWMGGITLSGDVKKDYDSDTVRMKVIKQGGNFYYFYNGEYWDTEFNEKLAGKVYAGFFANDGCTFSNYSFTDYEGKSDELRAEIGKSVYFVSVPGVSARGSVTSSRLAVKKGQPVTITFEPGSGYMLTDVKKNGVGIYDEVYNNSVDCSYTFTPDGDVDIEATYMPFPTDSRVNVLLPLRCGGESVLNASVIIYGDGNLSRYNVGTNSKGNAVIELPKAGVYDVGGKQISVSGNYRMVVTAEGYHDVEETFALNNETTSVSLDGKQQSVAADKAFTRIIAMEKTRYGSFKVNDLTVNSDKGFKHNQSTGNYYSDSGARTGYFGDTVASEYVVTFDTAFSEQTHTGTDPVAGGVVTSGGRTLVMKGCWWEGNRLCVAIGETTFTSSELSFSGFENSIGDNGNLRFTVAKYGRTLFVYDKDGALRIWFDESGIHTASGVEYRVTTGSKESFEKDLAEFFAAGDDNAVGIARYGSGGTTEWNVDWKAGGAYDYVSSGDFTFETETADYSATVSGLRVGNGFVKGSTVRIEVKAKNADKAASVLRLNYGDGQYIDVAGEYDVVKDATVFEIIAREAYTATVSEYADLMTVSGKLKADGVTDFSDATLEVESVGELSGVVNADGSFSVKTLAGVYNIRAAIGDKVAYVIDAQITESGSVGEIELTDDTFDLSETAVVNGKPMDTALNAPYYETPSFELRSKATSGEIDALGKNKAYLMPGTKTANDYVYSVNMKGVNAFAGMGITDGESILSFQVVSWEAGGQNLVLECDAMNYNSNSVEVRFPASANVNADATYTVTRTADCIVLSSGTGDKTTWLMRITADGYEFNGGIVVEREFDGKSSLVRLEAQQDRLAGFFGDGIEHMAVLYRNDTNGSAASYKLSFNKTAASATAGTIVRADGTAPGEGRVVLKSDKTCYVYDVDGAAFSAKIPYGTYDVEYTGGGYAAYSYGVVVGEGTTISINAKDATLMPGAAVTLNGRMYGGYNNSTFVTTAMKAATLDSGSTTIAAGHNSAYAFVLPGTKTSGEYEFTSRLTNENGNGQMGGIGITNGQYSLQFQLSNGEARGKRLIIELAEGWCGNDFVLNCESIDTDNVWSTDKLDATITIRRYADKIEVYVGRETVSKVVTITGDGYAYANAGWTVNNADRANGHKAKLAGFFGEGVEHAMVYASNYMVDEMTYTSRFEKIEYHELSAPVSFLDGNNAASGTLTLRNERGVTYTFDVNHGVNIVSVPYGSYSYVFNAEHYEQKSGAITFDAEHTSLSEIKTGRYIDETTLSAAEDEDKIIFTWAENAADIDGYKLVRKGETDVVVASTENGLTATDGTFTVTVDKTASDYVKGATYELVVTAKEGKLAPPADEFTAVEFGYGVINDLSSAEMAERFTVTGTGVTSGFDRGLKLTGGENATARIKSLRTCDLSGVSFVNVLLTGSGNATVAGKTVELNADGVYVNLTPEQYNGGEFDVTFSGSMTIKSIETDAMNGALATSWNETPGCGAVTRNEDGSYTITESNAGSRYSFTSLAMDKSVRFTVSANVKVKTVADKGAQHGFTISSPLDGKARGAMVYDTKYDEVWILSYVPGWTFKQIYRNKDGWLMSDADYNAVDKTNFKLTMVRDNAMLYLLLNDKPLACVNTEVYPMFITAEGSTEGVSIKDIPLVTGLASRNVQGSASDPLDTATYSDISLKLTAEHAALNRVTGTISGANANTELYIGKAGGTAIAACDGDGKYSALVPTGAKLVAYDGKKAAFMGEANEAGVKDGAMIDATWMVTGDYDLQKASAEGNGVYDAPAVNGLTPWLPSLATDKPFEFKSAITMRDATDPLGMAGISVVNPATGTRISMQSISWEGAGAKVLLDVQRSNEGNNPYVVACKSANVFMAATKNESGDITAPGAMNVGFKVSRTADRIVISAGPDGSEIKIATITASGIRLASEWSLGDGGRKPANDAKCAEFFADGVELTVGYESYDRFGRSVVYTSSFNEVAAVDVTGTAGTGTGTLDLIAASGAIYELTVTDGAVSGKAPEGTYKARYKGDDGYGSSDALTIASDTPITMAVTVGKSTAIRGGSYLINGNVVEANALGAAEAAASETGSVTLTNNTVNFYHMPDTLTSGDYEYVFNLKNADNMSGLAIYDGTSRFTVQIAAWEDGGKRVVVDCAGWMGNDGVLNVNGSTNTTADATFTVRRESNTIKVYMGSGESKILVFTVETDGTITLADGTTAANAEAFATRAANMKPLLANFVKSGSQNMVGLGRNDNRSQSVTYTTSFKPL